MGDHDSYSDSNSIAALRPNSLHAFNSKAVGLFY
jgi:hypothetical protein